MNFINSKLYYALKNSQAYCLLQPVWRFYYRFSRKIIMHRYASELLEQIKLILDENSVLFWLDFGTLLGAYRENKFISNDCDLDIAVLYKDAEKVKAILENSQFHLTDQYYVNDGKDIAQLSYVYKSLSIDICFYRQENDFMFCYLCSFLPGYSIAQNGSCKVAISKCVVPYSGFSKLNFQNSIYTVPSETAAYLSAHYGPHFMIPDSRFDYTKDAPNITKYPIEEKWGQCFYNK